MRREQEVLITPVGSMEITKIRWFYSEEEKSNVIDMIKAEFGDVPLEMIYGGVMVVLFRKIAQVEEQKRKRK